MNVKTVRMCVCVGGESNKSLLECVATLRC